MRVIVSGATGFLGNRLCAFLQENGHEVIGLGRNVDKGRHLEARGTRFVSVDVSASPSESMLKKLGHADVFVHAAGLSSAWGSRATFLQANVAGTRHALTMARAAGVRRFVFISSPSVTFRFSDQADLREDTHLPIPVNAYAESKQIAERDVLAASDLSPIILRPRAIYGRGDVALLPRLIRAAEKGPLPFLRGGRASTNLTYVDDVVRGIVCAMDAPQEIAGRTYNIAGDEALPLRLIIESAAARAGIKVRWRAIPWPLALGAARLAEAVALLRPDKPEPVMTAYALGTLAFTQTLDISAAQREIGFKPQIRFEQGLHRTFGGGLTP
ncbi:NAD-dependent epimerase/dehydratase family [Rhizobium freirei PRF 81]|uniref:NAD-dependent epimerase/dehydratase family n=1 Tax=Rhizobium freirei PRF 81 TaxID=363754 RepID=N6V732_9HYPH|nr:NAD(P)-dependent oxidoreductase [Rhizobium freirei]ENN86857.1 NAD-dependent epimerase/dehydratase family [Rhizobium freirei PRF 81]